MEYVWDDLNLPHRLVVQVVGKFLSTLFFLSVLS